MLKYVESTSIALLTLTVCLPGCAGGGGDADAGDGGLALTTYNEDILPVLQAKCAPCHTGKTPGAGSGEHNGAAFYGDAVKDHTGSNSCIDTSTVAECMLKRIQDGTMPQFRGCSGNPSIDSGNDNCFTEAEQDLFQSWLDDGTPEGAPL